MRTNEIQDSQFVSSAQEQRGEEGNDEHPPECCSTLGQCEGSPIKVYLRASFREKHTWWLLFFRKIKSKTQHHILY